MPQALRPVERRVLGVLLEKSLAQPSYYPMTLSAIVSACNQKSNREPVMELGEDTVWDALEALRQRGLVAKLLPGMGSRVDRFKHDVKTCFGWEKPQRAVMTELLLRGPQTVGELRARTARMFTFDGVEAVQGVLDGLGGSEAAIVAPLPRGTGQSAVRYTHLLYPDSEQPALAATAATERAADPADSADSQSPTETIGPQLGELQRELEELRNSVSDVKRRLEALEQQQG